MSHACWGLWRVKVCRSTYLFKVPETPNFSSSQLGHLMEMARRRRGGVHFLRGAPLRGPLGSNLVRFFPSDGVAFPGVVGAFARCSGHRAVSSLQNLKRSSVWKAERRPHPPAIFSSTPLWRGREGEPGANFQNKTLHHQKLCGGAKVHCGDTLSPQTNIKLSLQRAGCDLKAFYSIALCRQSGLTMGV